MDEGDQAQRRVGAEEMFWCGECRPCADGFPNHCEALQEIGFSCDGSFAPYVKLKAKYCWSLEALRSAYSAEDLFLAGSLVEATGLPGAVWPGIEDAIWRGRTLNSTVVIVARADAKIPLTGEVFQVRRASIVGSQGHSGHGTFPRVIAAMASGMDMTRLITKKITLDEVPDNLTLLQTDRNECKITAIL